MPFREFIGVNQDLQISQARLAKEVLEEIPEQFISYMKSKGIKPKPPLRRQSTVSSTSSSIAGVSRGPPPTYHNYAANSVPGQAHTGRTSVL